MSEINDLKELGLTQRQAQVYLALLDEGQCGAGQLLKRTGLYRVILYDTLDSLVSKGLVSFFELNRRKQFIAEDPAKLLEDLKLKESLAADLISRLSLPREKESHERVVRLYEGFRGIKSAQENYFEEMSRKQGNEYLMIGASFELHEKLDNFFNAFHDRRSKMGVSARLLFNPDNKKFGELKKRYKMTKVRYLPGNFMTPSWVSMYGDVILLGVMDENPLAIFIKNKRIADSYRNYFEIMWKAGRA